MVNLVRSEMNTFLNKQASRNSKNFILSSFRIVWLSHMYVQRHEEEEETRYENTFFQSSLPTLMEIDSGLDNNDASFEAPTGPPISLPLFPLNDANLSFMQTFVANIFIF